MVEGGFKLPDSEGSDISEEDFLVSLAWAVAPPNKINDPESPHWVFLVYSSCSMHVAAGCSILSKREPDRDRGFSYRLSQKG